MTGLRQLYDLVLLQQARQYLEQVLPVTYHCLDVNSLAGGQPKIVLSTATPMISSRFTDNMPASLVGRLSMMSIIYESKAITPESDHWLGNAQPKYLPIVKLRAKFIDYQGRPVILEHSIEFVVN